MYRSLKLTGCVLSLMLPLTIHAAVNPDKLIKVTPENNPQCVEFFNYKGAMYCSTEAQMREPVDPKIKGYEKQKIFFDDRAWQADWGRKTPVITTVEYVPLGDSVENWHELITSEFIPGIQKKATPKEFAQASMAGLVKAGFTPIITYIKETPDLVVLEFQIKSPANAIQDELQTIRKGPDGLYVLHYVIKEADMGQKNRAKWLELLGKSSIKK